MGARLSRNEDLSNVVHFLDVDVSRNSIEIGWSRLMADVVGAPVEHWDRLERYFLCSEHRCRESLLLREKLAEIAEEYLFNKLDRDTVLRFAEHCLRTARILVHQGLIAEWDWSEETSAQAMPLEVAGWYICPLCYEGDLRRVADNADHQCTACKTILQGPFPDRQGRYWRDPADWTQKLPLILATEPS